ncbi:DUF5007 domain-containing protein [Sphingobacterium spiritivorum]|uniref:DUF5007 domain-containing protein n=1 Tax=Sphingobacterium spiritivorum TaxID=258 RepID=UPI003DA1D0B7
MKRIYINSIAIVILSAIVCIGCKKNFPEDLDAFSLDMNFTSTEYKPVLGRTTYFSGNFNPGQTTLPLTFRISAVRTHEGKAAPELQKLFPVSVWKDRYTGEETSLEQINAKRETVMRPLWEIGEHSGNFIMHSYANSNILKTFPDSGYLFDVEVSSNGGKRFFRDMKLMPEKERSYEPYNDNGSVSPMFMTGVRGDSTRTLMAGSDIKVWFNKVGEGNSLTFKFLDPDLKPIKLSRFNTTKWEDLVHGFNMTFASDSSSVRYDVAYPIPLVPTIKTKYNNGALAQCMFSYNRTAFGGMREISIIGMNYTILEKGDWEMIYYFSNEAPLFDND